MEFMNCEQVANMAQCSVFRVREAVKRGELPAYKPAKGYLFTESAVIKWIESHVVKPAEEPHGAKEQPHI